ncbi:MAG: SRPBCC family protein [Deltaproteobacteria bacterium]|nr:SRPBCC family protein [Deltaproteobacteria bacterium]
MVHHLHREQLVRAPLQRVWPFFADPRNLERITSSELKFRIVTSDPPRMYAGQILEYRVGLAPGVWTRWLTEIVHVSEGRYFVDEQRLGPYRLWHHEHHFEEVPEGVRMRDHVTYALPAGPLGELVHALWVGAKLQRIFDFRREEVERLFADPTQPG